MRPEELGKNLARVVAAQRGQIPDAPDPHSELAEKFGAKLIQAKYWAMVEQIDYHVGRMLAALEETGQLDNTVIIFTSDHGESLGDHGLLLKGCRFYEGLVHVPLIVSWPSRFRQALRSSALVELMDLAPTLLELAQVAGAKSMQGRSLVPILRGNASPDKHREFVRSEFYRTLAGAQSFATMIRTEQFKQVVYHGYGLGELFDLERDPGEFSNLWDDPKTTEVKIDLLTQNFDALAMSTDLGPERTRQY